MKGRRQQIGTTVQTEPVPHLICLSLFFLGGILLGQVFARRVSPDVGTELNRYLHDYLALDTSAMQAQTIGETAFLYLRYPLLAVFLGFTSLGIVLLPCVTAAFGFFLSFSVCCFAATFGSDGILLALAVFGLRCVITMPCYFLLAVSSWETAASLRRRSVGADLCKPSTKSGHNRLLWTAAVILVLLVGICLDTILAPSFLQMAAERIV